MNTAVGEYTDWEFIDYKPAITEILPHALLPYIASGQTALDIGCNIGSVAFFLAKHGMNVLGVDINKETIDTARERAEKMGLNTAVRFMVVDITVEPDLGTFDVVLMIRLLTCFPSLDSWRLLQQRAHSLLKAGGILYINDFMRADESDIYRKRYEAGAKLGWRPGNFAVKDATGNLLFVAHHHSKAELQEITAPYTQVELRFYNSLSMNGNVCTMFEFIGRKPQEYLFADVQ